MAASLGVCLLQVPHTIQRPHPCTQTDRTLELLEQLEKRGRCKVLIFTATKRMADDLSRDLTRKRFRCMPIHGDKSQREREATLQGFRKTKEGVLVATDVAARGLDIRDLPCVINFDFPGTMEDYVHRIGRTGRAGDKGDAYTFLCEVHTAHILCHTHTHTHGHATPCTPQEDAKNAGALIRLLEDAKQEIPRELDDLDRLAPRGGGFGKGKGKGKGKGRYGEVAGRTWRQTLCELAIAAMVVVCLHPHTHTFAHTRKQMQTNKLHTQGGWIWWQGKKGGRRSSRHVRRSRSRVSRGG